MKNMGVVMSLSGSIILVIYFIIYPFSKRKFSIGWHRFILLAAMIFNIFPLPNYKYILLDVIHFIFPISHQVDPITFIFREPSIQIFKDGFVFSKDQKVVLIISGLLLIISLFILCSQLGLGHYFYMKHIFLKKKVDYTFYEQGHLLLKEFLLDLNIKHPKRIHIGMSKFISVPMVIGVRNPTIIIPSNVAFNNDELSFILRHELCHVKSHDLFWRFLGLFVMGLHWYNPFSYLLFAQFCRVSELFCDSKATKDLDINAKKKYCAFLIDLSTNMEFKSNIFFSIGLMGYKKSKLFVNHRICDIMQVKKSSKILSFIATIVILVSGSLSVLAYAPPNILNARKYSKKPTGLNDRMVHLIYHPSLENCFIDFSGNVIPIQNIEESKTCVHQFERGWTMKHGLHGDGSCVVMLYDCGKCQKCGYIKTFEHIAILDIHSNICMH